MRLTFFILALVSAVRGSSATPARAGGHLPAAPRCLRFEEPLGYSATGARERGDSIWYVLELDDGGRVTRPLFPSREREAWAHRSGWTVKGDTLRVRVSNGLVGWDMSLIEVGDGFAGTATYLSDVHVAGQLPLRMDVRAVRIECPVDAPAQQGTGASGTESLHEAPVQAHLPDSDLSRRVAS